MKRYAALLLVAACTHAPKPASQNPSPMVDFTRAHERLQKRTIEGVQFAAGKTEVLVTPRATAAGEGDLLIHFHGSAWLPFQAALTTERPLVVAAVNAGQGGGIYDKTFSDPSVFDGLVNEIRSRAGVKINRLYLSGFSAGYGAIRAILRNTENPSPGPSGHPLPASRGEGSRASAPLPLAGEGAAERRVRVDGILLIDGLHTSYIPDRKPIAEGGKLDTATLEPFLQYARSGKRFVFSHSEIFPGTFASTTETADYLIGELGLKRTPVVKWGPRGMQQLSEVRSGNLLILGFAGNSAPDHVDQFHSMPELLQLLFEGGSQ
jgi:hypothetical protein